MLAKTLRIIGLAVTLAVFLPTGSANAVSEEDQARAGELVQQGLKQARNGHFPEAISLFEAALKLYPHPEIVHNLARAHEENGGWAAAYALFNQALDMDAKYTYAKDARERIAAIEKKLRETHGLVRVRSTPSQVEVTLLPENGEPERHLETPVKRWIAAGKLTIKGQKTSFMDAEEVTEVAAGQDADIEIVLRPVARKGFLSVSANAPEAEVFVGGKSVGMAPVQGVPYPSGSYQVEVRADEYKTFEKVVVINPDAQANVLATMVKTDGGESSNPIWGAILLATGGAVLATGVIVHSGAFQAAEDANNVRPATSVDHPDVQRDLNQEFDDYKEQAEQLQVGAYVAYGLAAGLVGAGVYLLFFADDDDEPASAQVIPQLGIDPTTDSVRFGATIRF